MYDKVKEALKNRDIKTLRQLKKDPSIDFSSENNFYLRYCAKKHLHLNFLKILNQREDIDYSFNNFEFIDILFDRSISEEGLILFKEYLKKININELIKRENILDFVLGCGRIKYFNAITSSCDDEIRKSESFQKQIVELLIQCGKGFREKEFQAIFPLLVHSENNHSILESLANGGKFSKHIMNYIHRNSRDFFWFTKRLSEEFKELDEKLYDDISNAQKRAIIFKTYVNQKNRPQEAINILHSVFDKRNELNSSITDSELVNYFIDNESSEVFDNELIKILNKNENIDFSILFEKSTSSFNFFIFKYLIERKDFLKENCFEIINKSVLSKFGYYSSDKSIDFMNKIIDFDLVKDNIDPEILNSYARNYQVKYLDIMFRKSNLEFKPVLYTFLGHIERFNDSVNREQAFFDFLNKNNIAINELSKNFIEGLNIKEDRKETLIRKLKIANF